MWPEGKGEGVTSVPRVERLGPKEPRLKHIVSLFREGDMELSGLDLNDIQMYSPVDWQRQEKYGI